jgi:Ca-activated chloride channel family protein
MAKRYLLFLLAFSAFLSGSALWIAAQDNGSDQSVIRKVVDMVQLNVAVIDRQGQYVTGLRPSDFVITEDRIPQTIASFDAGSEGPRNVADMLPEGAGPKAPGPNSSSLVGGTADGSAPGSASQASSAPVGSLLAGAKVFILFDTSNYMYRSRGFVFAQDAIAEFVRSMDGPDRVAFYSYSRDFMRTTLLTPDRAQVLRGVRSTVNGADSALYNALLLTLKDAAQYTGRNAVVVFSNGPDNASMVPPEDVAEVAQALGVPIYMVSTRDARLDPVSTVVFGRISANTGGEAFFARSWKDQSQAFAAIREDLAHLYLLSYYPQPNPNRGWREITVKLVGERLKNLQLRTRSGYRPLPRQISVGAAPAE